MCILLRLFGSTVCVWFNRGIEEKATISFSFSAYLLNIYICIHIQTNDNHTPPKNKKVLVDPLYVHKLLDPEELGRDRVVLHGNVASM